jgi:BirA family biotin operon repressor/biotin-[acetyl-CoA-carboxylase] ligase
MTTPLPLASDIAPERWSHLLATARMGRRCEVVAICASTNDRLAALARAGAPEGQLVLADAQTGGRGRLGRTWHSPAGESLYLSLLLRPSLTPATLPPLTLLAGVAVADALAAAGVAPVVKWPNDVLLPDGAGTRKVAGILTEMATERERIRHVVLGIGINVNAVTFPPELANRAGSLRLATGRPHDRGALAAAVLNAFEPAYDELMTAGAQRCLERFRARAGLPRPCRLERDGGALEGVAIDVEVDGALLVRDAAGAVHRVMSGEIADPGQSIVPPS